MNLFYNAENVQNIHHYILEKQKKSKTMALCGWINSMKMEIILCKQILIFESKNDIISLNLNRSNNCFLYSSHKVKYKISIVSLYKITINYFLSPFFFSVYAKTQTQKS